MKKYLPLFYLLTIALLGAISLSYSQDKEISNFMHFFMGLTFCQFASLKLFNLSKFADEYQKYDLLAKIFRPYAFFYPFIELALGLTYLALLKVKILYIITAVILFFGAVGVFISLARGEKLKCACMGSILNVPLSRVSLVEDLGMGLMALIMLGLT